MKAPIRVLSLVVAVSFTTAIMPMASAQSQPATSPGTQAHNSLNRDKGAGTGVVGGRASHHTPRQVRKPRRGAWWNVIG
jgi:hypothetical protein